MRTWSLLVTLVAVGCGSAEGVATDPADSASLDPDTSVDAADALDDTAILDSAAPPDAPKDAADTGARPDADAAPKDSTSEVAVDTGSDAFAGECDGFSSKPLIPPTTCDKAGGLTSSQVPSNNLFSTSWFGCYRKTDGTIYKDPSDNCLFACGSMGLCTSGKSGPECESDLKWFSADADRFGCGARIRVTNCKNGKHAVLAALDKGPGCSYEKTWGAAVLDMSYPAMTYLFDGKTYGGSELQRVHVQVVPATTPLGPM